MKYFTCAEAAGWFSTIKAFEKELFSMGYEKINQAGIKRAYVKEEKTYALTESGVCYNMHLIN